MFKLKWNIGGRTTSGQSKTPPEQYSSFVREKRMELINIIWTSLIGVVIAMNLFAFSQGDNALVATLISSIQVIFGVGALSLLT